MGNDMKSASTMSTFIRKTIIDNMLSRHLHSLALQVKAGYGWLRDGRVLSLRYLGQGQVRLTVNLNFGTSSFFPKNQELFLLYRVYFIEQYLRFWAQAATLEPDSYFLGLALLCAGNDMAEGKTAAAYLPGSAEKPGQIRPVDVHCAIGALNRLLYENDDRLTAENAAACEDQLEQLFLYSTLPEAALDRHGRSYYSLPEELKRLSSDTLAFPEELRRCSLLSVLGAEPLRDLTVTAFVEKCEASGNPFWLGAALRILSRCPSRVPIKEPLRQAIGDYRFDSINYWRECRNREQGLQAENLKLIQATASALDPYISPEESSAGSIHCIQ